MSVAIVTKMDSPPKLCLADYDAFGFDLDHTIAKYNIANLFKLSYQSLMKHLVETKGFSDALLEDFEKYEDFLARGIIFDKEQGNFLKLNEKGNILRASHGTHFLSKDEIDGIYGKDHKWEHSDELINSVENAESFFIFENFFDMPGMLVAARIIDEIDRKAGKRLEKYDIWTDMVSAFNDTFRQKAFTENTGNFYPEIKKDVGKYVLHRDELIINWLKELKKNKKVVFLLTTSYVDYASCVAEQALGENWKSYFDVCCTHARKPGFFNKGYPFFKLEGHLEKETVSILEECNIYSQGNVTDLMKFLKKKTEKCDPKVAFFGDSLRSDVFPSKKIANWETVFLLEEMEIEGMEGFERGIGVDSPIIKKKKFHHELPLEEVAILSSSKWGSFFIDDSLPVSDGNKTMRMKHMNTFWGFLIRKYADIAVPQLEYLADAPLSQQYEVFDHEDETKSGFHPSIPCVLAKQ